MDPEADPPEEEGIEESDGHARAVGATSSWPTRPLTGWGGSPEGQTESRTKKRESLLTHQILLLSPFAKAFALRQKTWSKSIKKLRTCLTIISDDSQNQRGLPETG